MKKYIGDISYKTLSSTLKELEADKLINRKEYPQIPPKVEYSLTERGEFTGGRRERGYLFYHQCGMERESKRHEGFLLVQYIARVGESRRCENNRYGKKRL